jgi:hypothetical protein
VVALACVCSSELSALFSAPLKLPLPFAGTLVFCAPPAPPTEPTLHSLGFSWPSAGEIAGIT